MKRILILVLIVFAAGCGGNSAPKPTGTSMQGTWTVTGNLQCTQGCGSGVSNTYQVALVSSPCSVTTPVGMFSVQGPVCLSLTIILGRALSLEQEYPTRRRVRAKEF